MVVGRFASFCLHQAAASSGQLEESSSLDVVMLFNALNKSAVHVELVRINQMKSEAVAT